ncbi:hypothetical protein [Halobellus ordinarius]|uniref:hypothetical protein n=1 Tax=Halobellus ordinarius TaxID=3075120 RepID=UPI002880150E|nr:hypothetical protein [Halobellus sp. ZY16]
MSDADDEEVSRRWLIRILIGLGIGIPVAIEATTFLGLIRERLFGGGENEDDGTTTETATPQPSVGVGDELLPETPQSETLTDAVVNIRDDSWRFEIVVDVENTGEAEYELRLSTVTTGGGTTVEDRASTGQIPAGESQRLTNAWELPTGESPETLDVTAVTFSESGASVTERTVRLRSVSVES